MNNTNSMLPPLSDEQQQRSISVQRLLQQKIRQSGPIRFDEFMSVCLYEPGLGYYNSDQQIFGEQGDFVTAPELSDLFTHALGQQCLEIIQHLPEANIIELGAGSGKMTAGLLSFLETHQQLPNTYTVVETSDSLISRQKTLLHQQLPQLESSVQWQNENQLKPQSAIIIANEFFDALPFRRFETVQGEWHEHRVDFDQQQFLWTQSPVDDQTLETLLYLKQQGVLIEQAGVIDLPLMIIHWMSILDTVLDQGVLLIMDYGTSLQETSFSGQSMDSMRCFFQHRVHGDPFLYPGLQDITCHLPFSILKAFAEQNGFGLAGYTSQAHFLLGNRLDELYTAAAEKNPDDSQYLAQQFKTLTMPDEMGERFKVMALSKRFPHPLCGFSIKDFSHQL